MCMHATKDNLKSIEKKHTKFPWQRRRKRKEEITEERVMLGRTHPPQKKYIHNAEINLHSTKIFMDKGETLKDREMGPDIGGGESKINVSPPLLCSNDTSLTRLCRKTYYFNDILNVYYLPTKKIISMEISYNPVRVFFLTVRKRTKISFQNPHILLICLIFFFPFTNDKK